MRRFIAAAAALVIGVIVTLTANQILRVLLEDPTVAECVRTGDLHFTQPVTEGLAKVMQRQCFQGYNARLIRERAWESHPVQTIFIKIAVFFMDPIGLIIFAISSVGAYLLIMGIANRRERNALWRRGVIAS